MIENHTFAEIEIGDTTHLLRQLQAEDIQLFAAMSGDVNPAHVDPEYANNTQFHGIIAHGMWGAALISTVLGTEYPGPGTIYLSQSLNFLKPVHIGDTIDIRLTVSSKDEHKHHVTFECCCTNQAGDAVITGSALVLAPTEKIRRVRMAPMQVHLSDKTLQYRQLLALTQGLPPISVAVVHPCSEEALLGAIQAAQKRLIVPILVGPETKIRAVAQNAKIDLGGYKIVNAPHSHAAAALAVTMAFKGEVQSLMKGSLHTDELMAEIFRHTDGLSTDRRASHVFVLDVPSYPKPLLITDAAINIEPDIDAKRDIVQNAIDLAHAMGIGMPKVAVLAAVETVNAKMTATLDAAALCKMADRGQITGGIVDGPLAFDNAISAQAAKDKGIVSPVAGHPDILVAPNLDAANMLAKQLQYLADAQAAGIVMGLRIPIILTSRADGALARVASCALALLVVHARQAALSGAAG
ncbi:MAG: bifunctional enoyl-CoA hydratase/phosphate acetyltransferase [Burkholderiaceae bacterium]